MLNDEFEKHLLKQKILKCPQGVSGHRNNLWDKPGSHKKWKALDASVICSYSVVRQQPEDGNQGAEEGEFSASLLHFYNKG